MYYLNKVKIKNSGFTILEVIISLAIIMVIITAVYSLQKFIYQQEDFTMDSYISIDLANSSMQTLSKEIRNARNGDNGAYLLQTTNDQELIFFSNADNDPDIERIHYFIDNQKLMKGIINPTSYPVNYPTDQEKIIVLNDHIQNNSRPIFTYYNGNWPDDTTHNPLGYDQRLLETRIIGIDLYINSNPNNLNTDHHLHSYSQIRTIKDNL